MRPGQATVLVPGTCGELVQGTLEGIPFHVTCPIDLYSQVRVRLSPHTPDLKVPADCPKAALAMARTLEYFGCAGLGGELSISSPLPRAKGMASSTADVAGAIVATAKALGRPISPFQVAELALNIEPSDGSLFPGIVAFDHRRGRFFKPLGLPPALKVLVLDFGGEVDTLAFNGRDFSCLSQHAEPQIVQALKLVSQGMADSRPDIVGRGATLSALAHQAILFKPQLERVLCLARQVGALGVSVGHSGTVIGLLLPLDGTHASELMDFLHKNLPCLEKLYPCRLVSGGVQEATGS